MKSHRLPSPPLGTAVAVAVLAVSFAAPASSQMTHSYDFGADLVGPEDIAIYRPCVGQQEFVFVADPVMGALVRYDGNGSNNPPISAISSACGGGPLGVAVDDSIESPRMGQVYATDQPATGPSFVWIYPDTSLDASAPPACMTIHWTDENSVLRQLAKPTGIAVDLEGNLYVLDGESHSGDWFVLKVDAADIAYIGETCFDVEASLAVDTIFGPPTDVSVDKSGRIHVSHTCGCISVFYPDGTQCGLGAINATVSTGVDAKGDLLRSRSTGSSNVGEWDWDLLTELPSAAGSYGSLVDPRGLESQTYLLEFVGNRQSKEQVFVVDGGAAQKISVFEQQLSSVQIPGDAVARWRFDEAGGAVCLDDIGDNHLDLQGSPAPARVQGKIGCGLGLTGTTGEAWLGNDPDMDFGTDNFSIEGWICAKDEPGVAAFLDKRDGTRGYSAFLYNGYLGFQLMSGSYDNFHPQTAANFVADGKWHHVAIVALRLGSSSEVNLYVDGELSGSTVMGIGGSVSNNGEFVLGHNGFNFNGFTGRLDDLALYRRGLEASEIEAIFEAGSAGKHKPKGTIGQNYCQAVPNTTGDAGFMTAGGSPFVVDNSLFLTANHLPNNAFGFFIVSTTQGFVMNPGGSSGNLCVLGAIGRYVGPGEIQNTGPTSRFSLAVDLTAIPSPTGTVATTPGTTWSFQAWFRDSSPVGTTSNFTDGLEITFQ